MQLHLGLEFSDSLDCCTTWFTKLIKTSLSLGTADTVLQSDLRSPIGD